MAELKTEPPQDQPSVSSSRDQPKTPSFRPTPAAAADCRCSRSLSSSAAAQQDSGDEAEALESVLRGVRSSERLFFSPEKSNSILESAKHCTAPIMINMESLNPYMDFRASMEEMVEAHGLRDWEPLEELLGCYLMVNEKRNHSCIIRAFADLVISSGFIRLSSSSGCSASPSLVSDSFIASYSSPLHFSSSSTTAGTSCSSSSSLALAEAAHDRGRADYRLHKLSH